MVTAAKKHNRKEKRKGAGSEEGSKGLKVVQLLCKYVKDLAEE